MKKPSVSFSKLLHEKFGTSGKIKFGAHERLEKDWKFILTSWTIFFLILIIANIIIFFRLKDGEQVGGVSETSSTSIAQFNKAELKKWSNEMLDRQGVMLELSEYEIPEKRTATSSATSSSVEIKTASST